MTATTSIHGVCEEKPNAVEEKINVSRHNAKVGFYVHAKSKLDESISSLEDSVKDITAMPFDKVVRDLRERSSFEKTITSQRKQREKLRLW